MTIHAEISRILLSYASQIRYEAERIESLVKNLTWGYTEQEMILLFLYAERIKQKGTGIYGFLIECTVSHLVEQPHR